MHIVFMYLFCIFLIILVEHSEEVTSFVSGQRMHLSRVHRPAIILARASESTTRTSTSQSAFSGTSDFEAVPKRGIVDYDGKTFQHSSGAEQTLVGDDSASSQSSTSISKKYEGSNASYFEITKHSKQFLEELSKNDDVELFPFKRPTNWQVLQTRFNLWMKRMWTMKFFTGEEPFIITAKLTGDLPLDNDVDSGFENSWFSFPNTSPTLSSLHDVMSLFYFGAYDPRIQAIYLEIDGPLTCGYGKLAEVLRAIQFYRQSGKKVITYLTSAEMKEYLIATHCNEIYMPPEGSLDLRGLASYTMFYRNFLDKVGVEPQTYHIGKYKSFGDPFLRSNMSDAQREVTSAILSEVSNSWIQRVSTAMNKTVAELWQLWSEDPSRLTVDQYKERGMITGIKYKDQIEFQLREEFGKEPFISKAKRSISQMINRFVPWGNGKKIFNKTPRNGTWEWLGKRGEDRDVNWAIENSDKLLQSKVPLTSIVDEIAETVVTQSYRRDFNLTKDYELYPRRQGIIVAPNIKDVLYKQPNKQLQRKSTKTIKLSKEQLSEKVLKIADSVSRIAANDSASMSERREAEKLIEELNTLVPGTSEISKLLKDCVHGRCNQTEALYKFNNDQKSTDLEIRKMVLRKMVEDRLNTYCSNTNEGDVTLLDSWIHGENDLLDGNGDARMNAKQLFAMTANSYLRRMKKRSSSASDGYVPVGHEIFAGFPFKEVTNGPRIGIINAVGAIMEGKSKQSGFQGQTIGSDSITKLIRKAKKDRNIKAVVMRIDSPGGSALASDLVWKELRALAREKPVVASMVDVAASGGYYFAMACDQIIAEDLTLTGSIGVVAQKFNFEQLQKKMGFHVETISIGKYAELMSNSKPFSADEQISFQNMIKTFYKTFVSKAAAGRSKSFEELDKVAQGRVWTGKQAKDVGLVDYNGGFWKAIKLATALAYQDAFAVNDDSKLKESMKMADALISQPKIEFVRPPQPSPFSLLFGGSTDAETTTLDTGLSEKSALDRSVMVMASSEVFQSGLVSPSSLGMNSFFTDLGISPEVIATLSAQGYLEQVDNLIGSLGKLNVVTSLMPNIAAKVAGVTTWKDAIAKLLDDLTIS